MFIKERTIKLRKVFISPPSQMLCMPLRAIHSGRRRPKWASPPLCRAFVRGLVFYRFGCSWIWFFMGFGYQISVSDFLIFFCNFHGRVSFLVFLVLLLLYYVYFSQFFPFFLFFILTFLFCFLEKKICELF